MSLLQNLRGRDLLTLQDFTSEELFTMIKLAEKMKLDYYSGKKVTSLLNGKTLGMIFQKPSTRTRISFEVAMTQLGGHAIYLNWNDLQLGRGETIADTAKVLSRYVDGIMARVFSHRDLEILAEAASIPVINGLSDLYHPCQIISDMLTIYEKKGRLKGVNLTFIGDGGNNICHSLLIGCSKLGLNIKVACPEKYKPKEEILKLANLNAGKSGSTVKITHSPEEGVKDADIIYTDVWVSMGQEEEAKTRMKIFPPYQVNSKLLEKAPEDVLIMHCLPAHRGYEITDEVIDSEKSIVWDQAENRLHVQKAVLALLL
ncbi:MAG: ornithine carbamoyltransferase [archaeon GB-1845-036]|nr:ornithine carbamoyltransferase [Candidatus Verstraetearchaeota archaeon]MCS7373753.1 ornithine carbamoyltransferase [Candidatus Culexmicrobium thermophilum]HDO20682.1 ornithine carbamoyltransferase [Candidatus Bathyarchaeota archaeon]